MENQSDHLVGSDVVPPAGETSNDVSISEQHDYHDKRLFFVGSEDGEVGDDIPVNENYHVPVPLSPDAEVSFSDETTDNDDNNNNTRNSMTSNNTATNNKPRRTFTTRLQQKVHEHFFRSSKDEHGALDNNSTSTATSAFTGNDMIGGRSDPPASQVSAIDSASAVSSVISSLPPDAMNPVPKPQLQPQLRPRPQSQPKSNTDKRTREGDVEEMSAAPPSIGASRGSFEDDQYEAAPPPSTTQAKAAYEVLARLQSNYNKNIGMRRGIVASPSSVSQEEEARSVASQKSNVRFEFNDPKGDVETLKREKSVKWKQKMRIAQEKKRQERKSFDETSKQSNTSNALGMAGKALISCVMAEVEHVSLLKTLTTCGGEPADGEDSVFAYSEAESASSRSYSGSEEDDESNPHSRGRSRRRDRNTRRPSVDSSNASSTVDPSTIASTTVYGTEASGTHTRNGKRNDGLSQGPSETVLSSDNVSSPPTDVAAYNGMIGEGSMRHRSMVGRGKENNIKTAPSFTKAFIVKMEHIGARMLWHKQASVMNPATLVMFLKKGHRCSDGTHCGPRLVWSEIEEENGQSTRSFSIDLFDIASVQRADPLQLENFPFAIPGRTISINLKTDGENDRLIFEGASQDDAERMVRGLKLVVARMARNLVMGNMEIGCELLDLAERNVSSERRKDSNSMSPRSAMEFDWSRVMDDATEKLLESALQTTYV